MRRLQLVPCIIAILALYFLTPSTALAQTASANQASQSSLTDTPSLVLNPAVPPIGQISLQAGLGFNTHIEKLNVNVGGWYQIMEQIAAGIVFTYHMLESIDGGSQTAWSLDFLGRYPVYMVTDGMTVYAIGGINYLSWKWEADGCNGGSIFGFSCDWTVSDIGLAAGGMVIFPVGGFNLFTSASLILGGSSGLNIAAGGTFDL